MDPRLSHGLVAVVAVFLTVSFYEVSSALEETARAVSSDVAASTIPTEEDLARREDRARKRERDRVRTEMKAIEERVEAATAEEDEEDRRLKTRDRLEQRAEDRGLSLDELRTRRADRRGMSVEEHADRVDARDQWRDDNGLTTRDDRRSFRRERQESMDGVDAEALKDLRATRRAVFDADPSLRDAADVVRQLNDFGERFELQEDEGWEDE
jgi:hypothetical protein